MAEENSNSNKNVKYVGRGWSNQYGIAISLKQSEIAELTPNEYGEVRLYVGLRKQPDEKSKATHFVKVDVPRDTTKQSQTSQPNLGKQEDDLPF